MNHCKQIFLIQNYASFIHIANMKIFSFNEGKYSNAIIELKFTLSTYW